MKMYKKLFIIGAILSILGILTRLTIVMAFSTPCFIAGFILLVIQGITEITNKNKPQKGNYTYTYNKQKHNTTPPWEE